MEYQLFKKYLKLFAHIDADTGDVELLGNITCDGNLTGNGKDLSQVTLTCTPVTATDVIGNVLSVGNVISANISTTKLLAEIINATGDASVTGNTSGVFLLGNGARLTGILSTLAGNVSVNIRGNVYSQGNVASANISTRNIVVGNSLYVSGMLFSNSDITVSGVTGNVYSNVINSNVISATGNIIAKKAVITGNVYGNLLFGNGYYLDLDGYTIKDYGSVASKAERLALTNVANGSFVNQTDTGENFMLTAQPPNDENSWLRFVGANFPVISVFGRIGNVVLISGTDIKTVNGQSMVGPGDIKNVSLNVTGSLIGNVISTGNVNAGNVTTNIMIVKGTTDANNITVTGNVIGSSLAGNVISAGNIDTTNTNITGMVINGNLLIGNIGILGDTFCGMFYGNINATSDVNTANVSTTDLKAYGNIFCAKQFNTVGNITANFFVGNGSLITDVSGLVLPDVASVDIRGNVYSPGNVDATNVQTTNLRVNGNVMVTGQINTSNVSFNYFRGNILSSGNIDCSVVSPLYLQLNGNMKTTGQMSVNGNVSGKLFLGNVLATGNVDATNVQTTDLRVNGNVAATGQVNTVGNVTCRLFLGNVVAAGNVDATNVQTTDLRVNGNVVGTGQENTVGNVSGKLFLGNVLAAGNVDATNVQTTNLRVNGNVVVTGQINTVGNVFAGLYLGNVLAAGNVDATNVQTTNLRVNGNVVILGQVDVIGNVSGKLFLGNVLSTGVINTSNTSVGYIEVSGNLTTNVPTSNSTSMYPVVYDTGSKTLKVSTTLPRYQMPGSWITVDSTLPQPTTADGYGRQNTSFDTTANPIMATAFAKDNYNWEAGSIAGVSTYLQDRFNKGIWTGNVIVFGGESQESATSIDGVTWNGGNTGRNRNYVGIATSGNTTVMVARNDTYCVISTGISGGSGGWPSVNMPANTQWSDVAYNGVIFCAITDNGSGIGATLPAYALSGSTQIPIPARPWTSICGTNNGKFVMVANGTSIVATNTNAAATSWSESSLPISAKWTKIVWSGTEYCAISHEGVSVASSDGLNWTVGTLPAIPTGAIWSDMCWNGTLFVAVSGRTAASTVAASSPDGINWTSQTMPSSSFWRCIAGNQNKTISILPNVTTTAIGYYSTAATSFVASTTGKLPSPGTQVYQALYDGYRIFAPIVTSNVLGVSTDGYTWTSVNLPSSHLSYGIAYNGNVYVSVGTSSSSYSRDGNTWVAGGSYSAITPRGLVWTGNIFCTVGYNSQVALVSADGYNWTARTLPAVRNWSAITYNGTVLCTIAATGSNSAATSPDGVTWTPRTLSANVNWFSITSGNGKMVTVSASATGAGANVSYSSDNGVTWVRSVLPTERDWASIDWNGFQFVTASYGGSYLGYSRDAVTWSEAAILPASTWSNAVRFGKNFVYFDRVGNSRLISPQTAIPAKTESGTDCHYMALG